ncbi:MAG: hypothetical protein WC783_05810, partial [Candidatus Paceibacterota bacterium]
MKGKTLLLYLFLVLSILLAGTSISYAQVRDTDIALTLYPEDPKPSQDVTATLGSYSTDLNKAHISWSVNDQEKSQGIGKKSFSFLMENTNTPVSLSATINTFDGQSIKKTILITPTNLDILWEAVDVHMPPFYRGKSMVPSQGGFKVVAIPNMVNRAGRIGSSNLSYTWSKDGDVRTDSSGWGRDSYIFSHSYLDRTNTIGVKISDISGGLNTSQSIQLKTSNPEILFYKKDLTLGTLWENALSDGFRVGEEGETLVVEPLFFSPANINANELTFDWSINGDRISVPS